MAGNMEHTQRVIVKDYVGQWCTQCTAQTWHLEKVFINFNFFIFITFEIVTFFKVWPLAQQKDCK